MSPDKILLVVQPTINHYRQTFVRQLIRISEFDIHVGGVTNKVEKNKQNAIKSADIDILKDAYIFRTMRIRNFTWHAGLLKTIFKGNYDAIVVEGNPYILSNWFALLYARIRGIKTALWGHGWSATETGIKKNLRLLYYKLGKNLILYGNRAKAIGKELGVPQRQMHVIYNSIYSRQEAQAARRDLPSKAELRKQLSLPQDSIIYINISRLTKRHELAELIKSAAEVQRSQPVYVLIGGHGGEREALEKLAQDLDVPTRFLGGIYDSKLIAQLYAAADLAVIPAAAGLNVIQALGFGCPVITHNDFRKQGPEIEILTLRPGLGVLYNRNDQASLTKNMKAIKDHAFSPAEEISDFTLNLYSAENQARLMNTALAQILGR